MVFYDNMVYGGEGVPVNYDEASKYYKMAAKKGNSDAMYSYGNLLIKGEGVKHNKKEASRYDKMAADNDHISAMINYGMILISGNGLNIDKAKGFSYIHKAADLSLIKKNGNGKFGFDEFLEFMNKGLNFQKKANFPKQMRFLFDGMDTDGSHYLDKNQIIDCISNWKAENYKWVSKMIFLGADKDKIGKVPISELKDVSDNLGKSFDHESFEQLCILEFGKMHKELKYWEFYLILSGEVIDEDQSSFCCFLI